MGKHFDRLGEILTEIKDKEGKATVRVFLTVLGSKLTQYDKKLQKKNPSNARLGSSFEGSSGCRKDGKEDTRQR